MSLVNNPSTKAEGECAIQVYFMAFSRMRKSTKVTLSQHATLPKIKEEANKSV
jgi:hypothetical protein